MTNQRLTVWVCAGLFIASLGLYWLFPQSEMIELLRYASILSSLLLAFSGGLYSLDKYGFNSSKSLTLILLTIGIGCFLIGETLWTYYEYLMNTDPFPSLADVFYLAAYPLFFWALFREINLTNVNWRVLSRSLKFLLIMISALFMVVVCYFGVYLAYSPQETVLANFIAISYGIGDVALIVATIALLVLAWEFRGGALARIWMVLFFSFMLNLVADILFAIFTDAYNAQGTFQRNLIDTVWILSYVLFAHAMFSFGLTIEAAQMCLIKWKGKKKA